MYRMLGPSHLAHFKLQKIHIVTKTKNLADVRAPFIYNILIDHLTLNLRWLVWRAFV